MVVPRHTLLSFSSSQTWKLLTACHVLEMMITQPSMCAHTYRRDFCLRSETHRLGDAESFGRVPVESIFCCPHFMSLFKDLLGCAPKVKRKTEGFNLNISK